MKKPEPWYIEEEDGSYTEIEPVMGVEPYREKNPNKKSVLRILAAANPERVIKRKEYDKQRHEFKVKRFKKNYGPTIDALKEYRSLTAKKLGEITKVSEKRAKTLLERFYRARFVEKSDDVYIMTPENEKDIMISFGLSDK